MAAKIPRIINCKPVVKRDCRTLVWLQDGIPDTKINVYDGLVTSMSDFVKWHKKTRILAFILTEPIGEADLALIRKHKINLFVSKAIFEQKPRADWLTLGISIGVLEELILQFPVLEHGWTGDVADAVACITLLLHYTRLYTTASAELPEARKAQFRVNGVHCSTYVPPPEIWLLTQYFVHSVTKRAKEVRQCLKNNIACPYIDKIVLLNETDLKYEWSGAEKVVQEIIRTRVTYADLLKYVYEKVPANTIVIFANADIYCNATLQHLYSVTMEDKLFALLRWDEQESPSDLKICGPRPDSQDAWICSSNSIKSRTWNWPAFQYKLGTAGCDNRFTSDMFGMRFGISNPCQTIQTVHIHKTAIRNYNPTDIVPARLYMYIHPCALVELEQEEKGPEAPFSLSPRQSTVTLQGAAKKIETYRIMLARENRFKWGEGPQVQSLSPLKIYRWTNAFLTNTGIVFDYRKVYLGPKSDEYIQKVGRDLGISFINPCDRTDRLVGVPCPTTAHMMNVDLYCLHYLAYVIQIYAQLGEGPVPSLFVTQQLVPTIQTFVLKEGIKGAVPAIAWSPTVSVYAKEIVGLLPDVLELSTNEIQALRSAWPEWKTERESKCVVLVDEILTPEFVDTVMAPLLPVGWTVQQVLRTQQGLEAYRLVAGAGLVVLYNLPKQEAEWAKVWAVPKGCPVLEFQNELKVEGGCQQLLAAMESPAWLFPLYKGSHQETRDQIQRHLKDWFSSLAASLVLSISAPIHMSV
jgi:hypothetical protein